jgi:hypothetical protein
MVLGPARDTPQPVGKRHVAADGEAEVSPLGREDVRDVRRARRPRPSSGLGPCGLERRFHVEDDDIRRLEVHTPIPLLRADGAQLIGDAVPKLRFIVCVGALGCRHRDRLRWTCVQRSRQDV